MKEQEFRAYRLKAFDSVKATSEKFNLKPTPLKRRALAIDELSFCIADVENYVNAIKPASCPSSYKKTLRKLTNYLNSALTSIQKKRAPLKEIKALLANDVMETISKLQELISDHESDTGELTPEQIAMADSKHIKQLKASLLAYKSRFEHRVPRTLASGSGVEVVNVPLSVNLEKPIKQALLADIGLPIKPLSSNGYGSDLGYIFESQMLLSFSRSGAEQVAQQDLEHDLSTSSEAMHKEYLDEYRKELRSAKSELRKHLASIEGKRLTAKAKKRFKAKSNELEGFVSKLQDKVDSAQSKTKANFTQRKASRDVKKLNQVYIATAVKILDKLAELRGEKFTLVSNSYLVSPRNSDILLFWFMPNDNHRIINSLSSMNFNVANWDFAWSRTTLDSDQELQSVGLPTKLMNRG